MNKENKIQAMKEYAKGRSCPHCGCKKFLYMVDSEDRIGSGGNENCIVCKRCGISFEVEFAPVVSTA